MEDPSGTNQELIEEIFILRQRIQALEQQLEAERKQAEEELRNAKIRYRALFEESPNGILLIDFETGKTVEVNETVCKQLGYTREEFSSLRISDYEALEKPEETAKHMQKIIQDGIDNFETLHRTKNGEIRNVHVWAKTVQMSDKSLFYAIFEDITERKLAESALQESEKTARLLAYENELLAEIGRIISSTLDIEEVYEHFAEKVNEAIPFDRIAVNTVNMKDYTRTVRYVKGDRFSGNRTGEVHSLAGTVAEHILRTKSSLLINSENREEMMMKLSSIPSLQFGAQSAMLIPLNSKNEIIGIMAVHSARVDAYSKTALLLAERMCSQIAGAIANAQLFLECKQAEESLQKSEERYRRIVETSLEGIWITNEESRTTFVNQRMADMLGYSLKETMGRRVDSFMFEEDLADFALRRAARQRGVGDVFERRFRCKDGTTLWCIVSSSPLFDGEGRIRGAFSMFTDITERKKAEEHLQHTLDSLRNAVGVTIQVMVSAVEIRDPYTAGHQMRSANLARAIAAEMGLPREKIDGIRMAGTIHDIGKLSIPAEILSKPTKLSEIEFSLIKEHARIGYEMLKDVESPWSLAEIVYQHHERMDGSGYPRNLKGEEILMEARILSVADMVDAMASHRPYRPGLGIDAALNEIEMNRGISYDDAVADACLRLFREKGFQNSSPDKQVFSRIK